MVVPPRSLQNVAAAFDYEDDGFREIELDVVLKPAGQRGPALVNARMDWREVVVGSAPVA